MGFFTRHPKDDADPLAHSSGNAAGRAAAPLQRRRTSAAEQRDLEADQYRRRARRRLVGAIAIVLAAVIVVPMVLDTPPATTPDDIAIVIPGQNSTFEPRFTEPALPPELPGNLQSAGNQPLPAAPGEAAAVAVDPRVPASIATITPLPGSQPQPAPKPTPDPAPPKPATPPAAQTPARTPPPAPKPDPDAEAARALALLQGRTPSSAPSAAAATDSGRYAIQVVAVRSRSGADDLLGRLRGAGLAAYIETVKTPEGEVHRVRLGPYSSRSQAEAAQSRLRSLPGGYQGNLIPL